MSKVAQQPPRGKALLRTGVFSLKTLVAVVCCVLLGISGSSAEERVSPAIFNLDSFGREAPTRVLSAPVQPHFQPRVQPSTARDARSLTWSLEEESRGRFYRGHLLPRVERQFGRLGHYRWAAQVGQPLHENNLQEEVTQAAQKSLERATRRAIEEYLIEETALQLLVKSFGKKRSSNPGALGAEEPERRTLRFGVGIAHGLPELELRSKLAGHRMKLEIALDGELGVAYSPPRSEGTSIRAKFDPAGSRYVLSARIAY